MSIMDPAENAPAITTASDGSVAGHWRSPRQMLAGQSYDDHKSIHDDATAQKLGFQGGTIEGPTHFSQFAPLGEAVWGQSFHEQGCISVQYRAPAYDGNKVKAHLRQTGAQAAEIWMEKEDGTEILRGTASIGPDHPPSVLDVRLAELSKLAQPVILAGVLPGTRTSRVPVRMAFDQNMGVLYPFSLAQKLKVITEPSSLYEPDHADQSPFGRAIVPFEMISVLVSYASDSNELFDLGSAVALFSDQEIRLLDGPVFVDEPYEIDREVVAITGTRRTESVWVRTRLFRPGEDAPVATMLLNLAVLKDSYDGYDAERLRLYGAG